LSSFVFLPSISVFWLPLLWANPPFDLRRFIPSLLSIILSDKTCSVLLFFPVEANDWRLKAVSLTPIPALFVGCTISRSKKHVRGRNPGDLSGVEGIHTPDKHAMTRGICSMAADYGPCLLLSSHFPPLRHKWYAEWRLPANRFRLSAIVTRHSGLCSRWMDKQRR
jgi:hypothetical protein